MSSLCQNEGKAEQVTQLAFSLDDCLSLYIFFIEYNCSIVDKCQNFQINVALYTSSLQNAAMLDVTIVPCVARTNIFSSRLLCCEFSCRDDAVCIYSNWLPTGTDVLQTFCFSKYGVDWEKPIFPSSNWTIPAAVGITRASFYNHVPAALWWE